MLIGKKEISTTSPVFIIAEIGVNHNGSLELAMKLIDEAVKAGADAVKFQLFNSSELASPAAELANYQKKTKQKNQLDLLKGYEFTLSEWESIIQHCAKQGIPFLCTPFDLPSAKLLQQFELDAIKIGSGDITNYPLLRYIAGLGKPVILSTGMCGLAEIERVLAEIEWQSELALLHCTSQYPAAYPALNLKVIQTLQSAFGCLIGYSDHTEGVEVPIAATALGYKLIEKHFTLDKSLPGPDHLASLEPEQFSTMVQSIRRIEQALGGTIKHCTEAELETRTKVRRGIYARQNIKQGEVITLDALCFLRPVAGIEACFDQEVIGRKAKSSITAGQPLKWEHVYSGGCDPR